MLHCGTRFGLPVLFLSLMGCKESHDSQIWTGWNYTWEKLSHRVSLIQAVMEDDGTASMGLVGGDWSTGSSAASDSGLYRLRFQEVSSKDLAVIHGTTELIVGPEGTLTETVEIDATDLKGFSDHIVFLRGFSINTDTDQAEDYPLYDSDLETGYDPALGYCTQGFGFSVGDVSVDEGAAQFDVGAIIRWAPSGDEDPIDRSDMNEAIPYAQTEVWVAWTLVGFNGSVTHSNLGGEVDYAHGAYSDQPPLTGADLGLSLSGVESSGLSGLVSFDLGVEVTTDPEQGEYLRSFGLEILDTASALGPIDVQTEATNSSLIETASIRFSPSVELAWIELDEDSVVTHSIFEGLHDVGFVQVDSSGVNE